MFLCEMKTVLISDFKAKCIAMLKQVQKSGEPLTVTLRGRPIARVEPVVQHKSGKRPLGTMRGRLKIKTEIVRSDFEGDFAAR